MMISVQPLECDFYRIRNLNNTILQMSEYSEQATATEVPSANKNQHIKTDIEENQAERLE